MKNDRPGEDDQSDSEDLTFCPWPRTLADLEHAPRAKQAPINGAPHTADLLNIGCIVVKCLSAMLSSYSEATSFPLKRLKKIQAFVHYFLPIYVVAVPHGKERSIFVKITQFLSCLRAVCTFPFKSFFSSDNNNTLGHRGYYFNR